MALMKTSMIRACVFRNDEANRCVFDEDNEMTIQWQDGFSIHVRIDGDTAVISSNKEGLLSLAGQLRALAREQPGAHIHYDEYNSLEDGSAGLIIEKTP